MKHLLFTFFTLLTLTAFGQPTGNMEKDTARANRLYEEAITYKAGTAKRGELLKEAIEIYESHPFSKKLLTIRGSFGRDYLITKEKEAKDFNHKTITLALYNKLDSTAIELVPTYFNLIEYSKYRNNNNIIYYSQLIRSITDKQSLSYYIATGELALTLYYEDPDYTNSLIIELEELEKKLKTEDATFAINYFKLRLCTIRSKHNLGITYGNTLLSQKENPLIDDLTLINIMVELNYQYAIIQNYEAAFNLLDLVESKITLGERHLYRGIFFYQKEFTFFDLGDIENTIKWGEMANNIFLENKTVKKIYISHTYTAMAVAYFYANEKSSFLEIADKIINDYESEFALVKIGGLLVKTEEYDKGLLFLQKALSFVSNTFNSISYKDNPSKFSQVTSNTNTGLILLDKSAGLIQKANNEPENKIKLLQLAIETSELAIHFLSRDIVNERGYESFQLATNDYIDIVRQGLIKIYFQLYEITKSEESLKNLWQTIELKKAVTLSENLLTDAMPKNIQLRERQLVKNIYQYKTKIEVKRDSDSITYYRNKLLATQNELNAFTKNLISEYPQKAYLYERTYASIPELQETLHDNQAIVEYTLIGEAIFIAVITKNNFIIKQVQTEQIAYNKYKLQQDIDILNSLLKNPILIQKQNTDKFIDQSNELYQKLIQPIENELKSKSDIIIIPESELFYLPFEILLKNNEKKTFNNLDFFVKEHQISYQYSSTLFKEYQNQPKINNSSLLAFAPVFNNSSIGSTRNIKFLIDSLYRSTEDNHFISLPNTKKEVQTIAKILEGKGEIITLLETDATKANLNKAITKQPYQFIHIATHGLVNYQNPLFSALACHSETEDVEQQLLFANEIQMQDIQADLVILSSCESGIGQLTSSDGLIALNRSYIYSGANNVLFSLWKVSDKYSAELMINFYQAYMETNDYSAALRQAKLKMLKDPITANPRYWAAFVLIGE